MNASNMELAAQAISIAFRNFRYAGAGWEERSRMTSECQIAANRANAQASTGPRTGEGKANSSRNALKHGVTAKRLLPGESGEEFEQFREALLDELAPVRAVEEEIAERIVLVLWRMRRIPAFEAALFAWIEACHRDKSHTLLLPRLPGDRLFPLWEDATPKPTLVLGRAVESFLQTNICGKLSRYETALQRQLTASLRELDRLKAQRIEAAALVAPSREDDRSEARSTLS